MRAWLVTWEGRGYPAEGGTVLTVLSARMSAKDVGGYVERRYIEATASPAEMLDYARYTRPVKPPHPAHHERGRIDCGPNPWLSARLVDDLRVEADADGNDVLRWAELPPPRPS